MKIAFNNVVNFIEKIYSVLQKNQLSDDLFFGGEKNPSSFYGSLKD